MWLWQLKNVPKEIKVWAILASISLAAHVVLISMFVMGYRNHVVEFALTIHKSNPVFFVAMAEKSSLPASRAVASNNKNTVATSTPKAITAPAKPIVPKKEQAKPAPKKTGLSSAKQEDTKKPIQKNNAAKKPEAVKPESLVAKKDPVKKDNQKPIAKEVQKPIAVPIAKTVEPAVFKEEQSQPMSQNDVQTMAFDIVSDQSMPREYYNLVEIIMNKWRAPYGMQGEPSCRIKAFVNKHGTIENMEVEESSGVLMFDIAARSALLNTEMPEWIRGKSFVITFKQ